MHRFSSRSAAAFIWRSEARAGLTRRAKGGPAGVLVEYAEENNQGKEVGGASGHEQSAWMIAALQVAIDA